MSIFTQYLKVGKSPKFKQPGSVEARTWYREKAKAINTINTIGIMRREYLNNKTMIKLGYMYLFGYDPKTKEDLPYYDRFPLIFPIQLYGDGFLGINMHYLPYNYRAKLMDALYTLSTSRMYNEKTKLRLTYDILNGASKYKYFKPCVKRYLYSHVQTKFMMVPSDEWDVALFLPLESFAKRNKGFVQRESRAMINGV